MLRQSWIWLTRLVAATAAALLLLVLAALLLARFWLGSHLDDFRPRIEAALSHQVAVAAHIGHLSAEWHGLLPEFILRDVRLEDASGHVGLSLEWVSARLAAWPLLTGRVDFARLEIDHPVVRVQRRADGRVLVAGILLPTPSEEPGSPFVDWLLAQREVRINDGRLEWQDQLASGEVLTLPHLQLRLQGNGHRHQFALSAEAPAGIARGFRIDGTLDADDSRHLELWSGHLDSRADYLDVAGLRSYLMTPVDWRSGRGGMEIAIDFAGGHVAALQSDARLDAVALKLADDLPELRFDRLSGHLAYLRLTGGFSLSARQLLAQGPLANGSPQVKPADFDLRIDNQGGSARADVVNLGALTALTESLPVPLELRSALRERAPLGLVQGLLADWHGSPDKLGDFTVRAHLVDVAVQAAGGLPGVRHLSGNLQADQSGGNAGIDAQDPELDLPKLFAQPLSVHQLQASAHWTRKDGHIQLVLERARLDDPELAGELSGQLELVDGEARRSRIQGQFDRVEVSAVPRFLPLLVGKDARDWIGSALHTGQARQVRLNIDGDLRDFPFRKPGSGVFRVHVPVEGATLAYAPGWPVLSGIRGSVDFDGPGLVVNAAEAHQERLLAHDVVARVPALDADHPRLEIHGNIDGPLQSGLEFILQSPLRKPLGGFAGSVKVGGEGKLQLGLQVPLDHPDATTVDGLLQIESGSLLDPAGQVPPLTAVHGQLHFTDSSVNADGIAATVLGGPAEGALRSLPGGDVQLHAHGKLEGAEVDSFYGHGQLDFVRGSGDWDGQFRFGDRQTIEVNGHLPAFGSPAGFAVTQQDGPLAIQVHGSPVCSTVVGNYAPALASAAEGPLDIQIDVHHEAKGPDRLSGTGHCRLFGEPAELSLAGRSDTPTIDINGGLAAAALEHLVPGMPRGLLEGSTRWEARIDQRPGQPLVRIGSDLRGLGIALPAPFGKAAADALPLHASVVQLRGASDLYLSGNTEGVLGFAGMLPAGEGQPLRRLALRIGGAAVLPAADGISLSGRLASVDVATWRGALQKLHAAVPGAGGAAEGGSAPAVPLSADLQVDRTSAGRYRFETLHWLLRNDDGSWHAQVRGSQLEGSADWMPAGSGRLVARLERLWLTSDEAPAAVHTTPSDGQDGRALSAADIEVQDLQVDQRRLGHLEMKGEGEAEGWHLTHLALSQPHGALTADGHWIDRPGRASTHLNARIDAPDTGALLQALGYAKALSRGKTQLRASLDWPGDPGDFSSARIGGTLDLDSRSGQFLTLEPGVGRLLGLLSLQALPRRVTLDFRDIFSQGFAFDSITGHFDIEHGTMRTSTLEMNGPAALVKLGGSVDLARETQELDVRVQPSVGDGVAIATTVIGGPVAGAATFLVQKLLRNPIDQILTYEYHVSGSWDDPQVVHVARALPGSGNGQAPGPGPARSPNPAPGPDPGPGPGSAPASAPLVPREETP